MFDYCVPGWNQSLLFLGFFYQFSFTVYPWSETSKCPEEYALSSLCFGSSLYLVACAWNPQLFRPGTHLVCFILTSSYESSFISFCFLALDVSIGVRLPCPWSKPISHSLDVYQCLITEPLAVLDYRITTFVCCVLGFEMSLLYLFRFYQFSLLSTCGLRPASALRTCTLNTLLWVEFCLVTRAWKSSLFRPGTHF